MIYQSTMTKIFYAVETMQVETKKYINAKRKGA